MIKKWQFGPWKELRPNHNFTELSLKETLQGGQSFDWNLVSESHWRGKIHDCVIDCRWWNDTVEWRCNATSPISDFKVAEYFWLGENYEEVMKDLPWRSDPVLKKCVLRLQGLRILRQPIDQTLFFFLLSSAKSITQIQTIGDAVFRKFGRQIFEEKFVFPGWDKLAEISEDELRTFKLGYRAKYVAKTAKFIVNNKGWLESIQTLPYEDAKNQLLRLPGVGEKVADCVLLFGANFLEAFPVDTWIEKSLDKRYSLYGWKTSQKIHFAKTHFGKFAGLAQQFLFSAERLGIFDEDKKS